MDTDQHRFLELSVSIRVYLWFKNKMCLSSDATMKLLGGGLHA